MRPETELFNLARRLEEMAEVANTDSISKPLENLEDRARAVGKAFSGSWLGYHSRVYYDGLKVPPPGAHFSQEWGLKDLEYTSLGSRGTWREFNFDAIKDIIHKEAGGPDITEAHEKAVSAATMFDNAKAEIVSILLMEMSERPDVFLENLRDELEKLSPLTRTDVANYFLPKGQIITRDDIALGQGSKVPPHIDVIAEVMAIRHSFGICKSAADIARKAASHLERKSKRNVASTRLGTNVFIGHGRSGAWRELKDFVQDRLRLPWDEFNRVPVAGITNIARLSEMLDAAAVAFLIMTAEDEMADGKAQARMNVVHEAGLFQGRLGFTRAIVMLEDGCEEFSNIQGLGQIRFQAGNIGSAFEEVRRVLEREGLIT